MRIQSSLLIASALYATIAFAPQATAQASVETFENGNPDNWELWFSVYNSVQTTGGNPGAYLELDNTSGPATCQFVEGFPGGNPGSGTYAHTGDWRAQSIDTVSFDMNVIAGAYGGDVILTLISDPGTPSDPVDDCAVSFRQAGVGPAAAGWQTYTFAIPSAQTSLPGGWEFDPMSPCSNGSPSAAWNQVMQDMDQMTITYDSNPAIFCTFTNWTLGIDNITVGAGSSQIGTNYCMAAPNSTGMPGVMSAIGSNNAANNNLTITAADLPANQFGIFLTSRTQAFVPTAGGTSNGNLCLGGNIGRFSMPGQILSSGSGGTFSLSPDLSALPEGGSTSPAMTGDTWNFQAWYRDGVGLGSNFTDGFEVLFL